ncbi:hypothetical protein ACJJTC_016149 [Scirpophaga incertulas]
MWDSIDGRSRSVIPKVINIRLGFDETDTPSIQLHNVEVAQPIVHSNSKLRTGIIGEDSADPNSDFSESDGAHTGSSKELTSDDEQSKSSDDNDSVEKESIRNRSTKGLDPREFNPEARARRASEEGVRRGGDTLPAGGAKRLSSVCRLTLRELCSPLKRKCEAVLSKSSKKSKLEQEVNALKERSANIENMLRQLLERRSFGEQDLSSSQSESETDNDDNNAFVPPPIGGMLDDRSDEKENEEVNFDFSPEVREAEPPIPATDEDILRQGTFCHRFNEAGTKEVTRYTCIFSTGDQFPIGF